MPPKCFGPRFPQRNLRADARAGDAIRTRDSLLGKQVLYQLSYTREANSKIPKVPAIVNRALLSPEED